MILAKYIVLTHQRIGYSLTNSNTWHHKQSKQLYQFNFMFLFFLFLFTILNGQTLENANHSFQANNGSATIYNHVSCSNLKLDPLPPFQNIKEDIENKQLIIKSSATPDCIVRLELSQNMPQIFFNRRPLYAGHDDNFAIKVSLAHNALSPIIQGSFNFSVIMTIKKYTNLQEQQVQIILTSTDSILSTSNINLTGITYKNNNLTFQLTYNQFILDSLLILYPFQQQLINRSLLSKNDSIKKISLRGKFIKGGYQTKLKYSLDTSSLRQRNQKFIGINEFYFKPTYSESSDYQYLIYPFKKIPHFRMYFVTTPNNLGKIRPCSGERIGLFKGKDKTTNINYDYFPLDPALKTKYYFALHDSLVDYIAPHQVSRCIRVYIRRDYNASTHSFDNLPDQTCVSKQIFICTSNLSILQKGFNRQQVIYQDEQSIPTVNSFTFFQQLSQTTNIPSNYTFLANIPSDIGNFYTKLDVFFFLSKLFNMGKIRPNERISQISRCTRFFEGAGTYTYYNATFPIKSQITYFTNCSIKGCIQCDSAVCFACAQNWTLLNYACKPIKQDNDLEKQKSLSCLLPDENITEDNCLNAQLSVKAKIALTLTSTPNIGLILKVSQLVCLVDDFMFYVYVNLTYGQEFNKFLYLMWNMSMERWVPYSLSTFYFDLQSKTDQITKASNTSSLTKAWVSLDEDSNFIRNTRSFWVSSITLTFLTFVFIHIAFRLMQKYQIKFRFNLIKFKWFSITLVNIGLQNLQLLSFRAFQHILYGGPPPNGQWALMYYSSQVLCYVTLFFIIVSACAGQFFLRILIGRNVNYSMDLVWYGGKAVWFMILTQIAKVIRVFVYANSFFDSPTKMSILSFVQIALLFAIVSFRAYFRRKTMFALLTAEYILRVVVHVCLLITVWLGFSLSLIEEQVLDQLEMTIIWIIFGVAGFELLTPLIRSSKQPEQCAYRPKTTKIPLALSSQGPEDQKNVKPIIFHQEKKPFSTKNHNIIKKEKVQNQKPIVIKKVHEQKSKRVIFSSSNSLQNPQ